MFRSRFRLLGAMLVTLTTVQSHGFPGTPPGHHCQERLGFRGVWAAQIATVQPSSPAESMGLRLGDLITAVNGKKVEDFETYASFIQGIRDAAIHDRAILEILRDEAGKGAFTPSTFVATLRPTDNRPENQILGIRCGLVLMVTGLATDGPACAMGLRAGDFIDRINDHQIANLPGLSSVDELVREIEVSPRREIVIQVVHWIPTDGRSEIGQGARELKGTL